MLSIAHESADSIESLDVALLGGKQRVLPEVREHALYEVADCSDLVLQGLVGPIWADRSAFPPSLELVQQLGSLCVLANREARSHLPTEPMSRARLERNAETAFAVDEARDVRCNVHVQGRRFISCRSDSLSRDLNP